MSLGLVTRARNFSHLSCPSLVRSRPSNSSFQCLSERSATLASMRSCNWFLSALLTRSKKSSMRSQIRWSMRPNLLRLSNLASTFSNQTTSLWRSFHIMTSSGYCRVIQLVSAALPTSTWINLAITISTLSRLCTKRSSRMMCMRHLVANRKRLIRRVLSGAWIMNRCKLRQSSPSICFPRLRVKTCFTSLGACQQVSRCYSLTKCGAPLKLIKICPAFSSWIW